MKLANNHISPPGPIQSMVEGASSTLSPEFLARAAESLANYTNAYSTMGYVTVGIGLFLVLLSSPLNKMMHGVK